MADVAVGVRVMVQKWCPVCQQHKPATHFPRHRGRPDGLDYRCRKCAREAMREHRKTASYRLNRVKPKRRLRNNLTTQMRTSVDTRDAGGRKWERKVGWTFEQLVVHLEAQFEEGMTWDNYGKWHLDHIKPRCSFEMPDADCEGFRECWALSNLRPLWGWQNLIKGPKYFTPMFMDTGEQYEGQYEDYVRSEEEEGKTTGTGGDDDIPF